MADEIDPDGQKGARVKLAAHGLGVDLPEGWEGTITAEEPATVAAEVRAFSADAAAPDARPVAHLATFALPPVRDDFGGDVVDRMTGDDVFVALLEYAPEEAGSALFADRGVPRTLDPRAFSPQTLQRRIAGHAGLQVFFTHRGRPFCLYVVLGDAHDAHRLVRRAEQVLATIDIEDRPA